MNYKVTAIPEEISSEARSTLRSPQYRSLAAAASVANGYGPCRSCLRVFEQGKDRRIYLTYNAFEGRSNLPDPGPVFIHENECGRFEGSGFPEDLKELPILFEAFGEENRLLTRTAMDPDRTDEQIAEVLSDPQVRFINLRNAEAGCFIATVERT
jgi:hypothetical protein